MPENEKGEYEIGPEIDIRVNEDQVEILKEALGMLIRARHDKYFNPDGTPRRTDYTKDEDKEIIRITWDILDLMGKLQMIWSEDEPEAETSC